MRQSAACFFSRQSDRCKCPGPGCLDLARAAGDRQRGNQIIPELAPAPGEIVLDKPGKGAFYATPLHELLTQAGVTHLVFMGVTTEVGVQTSMREANDRGYDSLLLEDCTESYFPQFKAAAVEMMRAQGAIVGWTATSGQLLAALAAESR